MMSMRSLSIAMVCHDTFRYIYLRNYMCNVMCDECHDYEICLHQWQANREQIGEIAGDKFSWSRLKE